MRDPITYKPSGIHTLKKQVPAILERINEDACTDLTTFELAAKEFRDGLIEDCGGRDEVSTAKLAMIQTATVTWLLVQSIDAYLMKLAAKDGLVNKKHRRLFQVCSERTYLAHGLAKQLQALGLERAVKPLQTIDELLRQEPA